MMTTAITLKHNGKPYTITIESEINDFMGKVKCPEDIKHLPGIAEALKSTEACLVPVKLRKAGYEIEVIQTGQSKRAVEDPPHGIWPHKK